MNTRLSTLISLLEDVELPNLKILSDDKKLQAVLYLIGKGRSLEDVLKVLEWPRDKYSKAFELALKDKKFGILDLSTGIFKIDITPVLFKSYIEKFSLVSSIKHRRWNSVFEIYKTSNPEKVVVFHLMFDKDTFEQGVTTPERANRIKFIGIFKSTDTAKKYLSIQGRSWNLPQDKSVVLHPPKSWTPQDLGV